MVQQGQRVAIPLVSRRVEDLLLWRDPVKTGIAFALATAAYFGLEWSGLSLLTILANLGLLVVSIAFLWNSIANFTSLHGPPVPEVVSTGVRESDVKAYAEVVAGYLNQGLGFFDRILKGKEIVLTAQVAVGLWFVGKLGGYFTSLGLLYTIVLLAFTVPKAYELNKPQVDRLLSHGHAQVKTGYNQYVQPYVNKIPRASTSTTSGRPLVPPADTGRPLPNAVPNGGKKVY